MTALLSYSLTSLSPFRVLPCSWAPPCQHYLKLTASVCALHPTLCCQVSRVPIMSGDDTSRSLSATSQPSQKQQSSSSGNTKHTLILNSPAVLIKSTLLGNTGSDLTPSHCSVSLTSFPFRERTSPVTEWLTPRHLTPSSKASAH